MDKEKIEKAAKAIARMIVTEEAILTESEWKMKAEDILLEELETTAPIKEI